MPRPKSAEAKRIRNDYLRKSGRSGSTDAAGEKNARRKTKSRPKTAVAKPVTRPSTMGLTDAEAKSVISQFNRNARDERASRDRGSSRTGVKERTDSGLLNPRLSHVANRKNSNAKIRADIKRMLADDQVKDKPKPAAAKPTFGRKSARGGKSTGVKDTSAAGRAVARRRDAANKKAKKRKKK